MEDFPVTVVEELPASPRNSTSVTDDWVAHRDSSGKRYFYSESRKKSLWAEERPDITPCDDVEVHKTLDGRSYSYSKLLRKSFWIAEEERGTAPGKGPTVSSSVSSISPPTFAHTSGASRSTSTLAIATPGVRTENDPATTAPGLAGGNPDGPDAWRHHTDPKSGKLYYYNKITGTSSWSKPSEWSEHVDPLTDEVFYKHGDRMQTKRPEKAIIIPAVTDHAVRLALMPTPTTTPIDWVDEVEQLLRLPCVQLQLNSIMRHWSVQKIMHWVRNWKPERVAELLTGWPTELVGQLFNSPDMDLQSACHCCKTWDLMDVAQILKYVTDEVSSKIITELYDEEELWDDDTVSEVLEQLEVSKISNFLLQYEAEDAAGILRHWGKAFIAKILDCCDPDWRNEVLKTLDEMNAERLWSTALANHESPKTSEGSAASMKRLWQRLDVDSSGYLDLCEIEELLAVAGVVSVEAAKEVLCLADTNGDGRITFDEFSSLMKALKKRQHARQEGRRSQHRADHKWMEALQGLSLPMASDADMGEEALQAVWMRFDADHSGSINAQELYQAMVKVGIHLDPTQLRDVVGRADTNSDGTVSFEEFSGLVRAIATRQARRRRAGSTAAE